MKIAQKAIKIELKYVLVIGLFICAMLTGIIPQQVQATIFVVLLSVLFFTDGFYLAFPIVLFYYSNLGMLLGISVYRIFSLMFILKVIISKLSTFQNKQQNAIDNSDYSDSKYKYILVLMVYFLYEIIVMVSYNTRIAIFSMVDVICIILFITQIFSDNDKLKKMFSTYALTAIIAFFSGFIINNNMNGVQLINGEVVKITRFMSTFNDPNYMGLFYSVAIFAVITLKLFPKKLRFIMIIALYVMLASSISMTAIIGNILFWIIYLFTTKKINLKAFVCIIVTFFALSGIYQYGVQNKNAPIIGDLAYRIEGKINNLEDHDAAAFTTNRSELTKEHWDYFWKQPIYKILFGGNRMNSHVSELDGMKTFAAHNEYVDSLLNVGIIGTLILLSFAAMVAYKSFKVYRKSKDEKALCVFMIKSIWFYYAATLTMFLEFRFMIFFFI